MLKLPPPIWGLLFVVVCAGVSWAMGWPRLPGLPLPPLGLALVVLGAVPAISAVILFRRQGTELNPTSLANAKLVTSGPYRFTRNPMYVGLVIEALGIAVWVGAWPMFVAPVALFVTSNWIHIPFEEAKMRSQFASEFDAYASKVRRWV